MKWPWRRRKPEPSYPRAATLLTVPAPHTPEPLQARDGDEWVALDYGSPQTVGLMQAYHVMKDSGPGRTVVLYDVERGEWPDRPDTDDVVVWV